MTAAAATEFDPTVLWDGGALVQQAQVDDGLVEATSPAPPPPAPPVAPLPVTPPVMTLPPVPVMMPPAPARVTLALPAKVGIAVSVVVVVVALVVFLVYWFVVKERGSSSGGSGSDKFGVIEVTDTTTRVQSAVFAPGDVLQLSYRPSSSGFSGQAQWSLSTDGGQTFPIAIADPTLGNSVSWTIPLTVFTNAAVFRVADAAIPADYVDTTTPLTIQPVFALQSGPGLAHDGDIIYQDVAVTCGLTLDTGLTGLSATGFAVTLSADPQFVQGVTAATVSSVVLNAGAGTATVVWTVGTVLATPVYYRVATTTLKANGYPSELSATSPRKIAVQASAACSGSSSTFSFCQLTMVETSTGKGGNYTPGSAVVLTVAYSGTFPGTYTLEYRIDGGAAETWSSTVQTSAAPKLVLAATLPNTVTRQFEVLITAPGANVLSSGPFPLVPSIVINETPGSTIVLTQYCGGLLQVKTTLTVAPASYHPVWQVGHAQTDGSDLQLFPVRSTTYVDGPTSTVATVSWCMDWSSFTPPLPVGNHTRLLVFSANGGEAQQSVSVVFDLESYQPKTTALFANGQPMSESLQDLSGNFVAGFTLGNTPYSVGMWPDPKGSDAVYIFAQVSPVVAFWWGSVAENQNLSIVAPFAPNPVNYVACFSDNPTPVPARAALYVLAPLASASGTIQFAAVDTPTQALYYGVLDPTLGLTGLYALNAGTVPSATSSFSWPGQILPF